MTMLDQQVNPKSTAVIKNVAACLTLADSLITRPFGLSGFGVFSGYSGLGKSQASQWVQNKRRAIYLEVKEWWTRKIFVEMLLIELGEHQPRGTIGKMMFRIIEILAQDHNRLLIIDEADKLVDKGMIELVRSLQHDTQIPIMLVGEELLPQKLKPIERMFERVAVWELAQPCDLADTKLLSARWLPGIAVTDDFVDLVREKSRGKARNIVRNFYNAGVFAQNNGLTQLTRENFTGAFDTGEPQSRKR